MNGFLVLLRHSMDDIPLGLFATEREALAFAVTINKDFSNEFTQDFAADASTPILIACVEFVDGLASEWCMLIDLERE